MKNNRVLIICCIIGIILGYAVGYFTDIVPDNTALTIGLIGGLVVGYLLDKGVGGTDTDRANKTSETGSTNDAVARAKAAVAAARGEAVESAEKIEDTVEEKSASAPAAVDEILAKARNAVNETKK